MSTVTESPALSKLKEIQHPAELANELDTLLSFAVGSKQFKKLKGPERTNITLKAQALCRYLRSI
ncbi:hypothetical protein BWI93_05165 [Siphonobacter sp. BAB-5385]|uniref:hypothetical protein n=1 Tax=Siphonobacter sp. BAB-5385 TaxID=1864822 RepID=UPI000B9DF013|nr:hypothetical protein [Siphonobacter sp. BAB-5385]OZI09196.1 hypothetical protein BWI93_05165 [Siphonobacter sp. BAB-5385]